MEHNKEQIIKSLKTCSDRLGKCEDCIYFTESFDKCHNLLCKDALKVIKELSTENQNLKSTLEEVTDLVTQISNCIGG